VPDKSPIVRVEFEYADGSIQRLSGPPAEAWLEDVNNVMATWQLRYGQRGEIYPWEHFTKRPWGNEFRNYEGTD